MERERLGFALSFEPRRPGVGRRTSGRGQAIEHGPETTLYVIDLASNPACSLETCDLASHATKRKPSILSAALPVLVPSTSRVALRAGCCFEPLGCLPAANSRPVEQGVGCLGRAYSIRRRWRSRSVAQSGG